jgi:glycolate oxidase iron-sulfur subunit
MGVDELARRSGLLRVLGWAPLEALAPKLPPLQPWRHFYPARVREQGQVALFRGCIADVVDQSVLLAAVQLLNQLGYGVHVPSGQVCCGALARHEGEPEESLTLALRNIKVFAAIETEAVICTASGCTASLIDYPQWVRESGADMATTRAFAHRLRDINQFLLQAVWPTEVVLEPLAKRIVVQEPCSLRYILHQHEAVYSLLRRIPKAEIISLPHNDQCCGAAGSYMLTQPVFAQSLRAEKINALKKIQPDILVTSNVGCSLYLAAGVREARLPIEVVHPVQLLVRQMNFQ